MTASNLIFSLFFRNGTFAGLWNDFWFLVCTLIVFVYCVLTFKKPMEQIYPMLIVRAILFGSVSINEMDDYGIEVMSNEDLTK